MKKRRELKDELKELHKLEQEKSAILNSLQEAVIYLDRDMKVLWSNKTSREPFGLAVEQVAGRHCYEIWCRRGEPHVDCPGWVTLKTGQTAEGEISTPDGRVWQHRSQPVLDAQGNVAGIVMTTLNITGRKRAEEELQESEKAYRTLAENLPGMVYRVFIRENNRMQFFNDMVQPLMGYSTGDLRAGEVCSIEPLILDADRGRIVSAVKQAIRERRPFELTYRLRRKDGEIRCFSERGRPVHGDDGEPLYIDGVIFDITDQEKAELEQNRLLLKLEDERQKDEQTAVEARERASQLDAVFQAMPQPLIIFNTEGTPVKSNAVAVDYGFVPLRGGTSEKITEKFSVRRPDGRLVKEEDLSSHKALKGERATLHSICRRPDGKKFHVVSSSAPFYRGGNISGAVTVLNDVTEREELMEELQRSRDELEVHVRERTRELARANESLRSVIEEREQAQKKLAEQSKILEAFFSLTITPLVLLDKGFNFVRANEAYARSCRRDISEFRGHNHFEFYPNQENEAIFRKVIKTKVPYQAFAKPFTFPDHAELGVTYWDWTLTPILNDEGEAEFLVLALNDVTKGKRAEEALKASSVYTRNLIEASLDPLVTIGPDGKINDVNRASELVTEVSRDKLIGRDFSDCFTEPARARRGFQEAFLKGSIRDFPLTMRGASGKVTDVLYNATVYRNEAGVVRGVLAAARDVTRQKIAEEERRLLAMAVEQAAGGVLIMDSDFVMRYANPALMKITGYSLEDLAGTSVSVTRDDSRRVSFHKSLQDTILRNKVWGGTYPIRRRDGTTCQLKADISPARDGSGAITHYVILCNDITDELKLEERLRQAQKMEALGTLAGGIAHDFNNLLSPIILNTELALGDILEGTLPPPDNLEMVLRAAERGRQLVKQILAFSRQKERKKSAMEIAPIIKEATKFLRSVIPKSIEIREFLEAGPDMVLADPTQIYQVLMNLCSNAAHAMREKGGTLEITLARAEIDRNAGVSSVDLEPGPYLRLTVRDTGVGMDREVRARAFDPFFTTKRPGEGTGMGLPVVHGIVEDHKGAIILESEVGKGTTVSVYLPVIQGSQVAEISSRKRIYGGNERILLVDDEKIQVQSLQNMLKRLGYRVTGRTDPRRALNLFKSRPGAFDLAIIDQSMPYMTGSALAHKLFGLRPDFPVILCTGFSELIDAEEALAQGIRDFAMKPLTVLDLAQRIRRALKRDVS